MELDIPSLFYRTAVLEFRESDLNASFLRISVGHNRVCWFRTSTTTFPTN